MISEDEFNIQTKQVIDIVNRNHKNSRSYDSLEHSTQVRPVKRNTTRKRKPKNYRGVVAKTMVLTAISVSLLTSIPGAVNAIKVSNANSEILDTLGDVADDNISYGAVNTNAGELYWWYDERQMAEDILNNNQEYDIDTRIYGCYKNLKEYQKEETMDSIFYWLSYLVSTGEYSEDIVSSCAFKSFKEYLTSKGLTEEEWSQLMKSIVKTYANEKIHEDKRDDLLDELNDTTGGR